MSTQELDWFEQFERATPEPKLELIDGRLVIGNSAAGSRYYLHDLLTGWGVEAALAFAPADQWRMALTQAFAALAPPGATSPLEAWGAWAGGVRYEPTLAPAGPRTTGPHFHARERLQAGLSYACQVGRFGTTLGHDFVMRLGGDGFTPDAVLIGRQATERLFERYLNGPADLACEVLLPGHERQDREVKRRAYEAGGVPHYWLVDSQARAVQCLRLAGGRYRQEAPGSDGAYRPAAVPGLAFWPERLWQGTSDREAGVLAVEAALSSGWSYKAQEGIGWDDVPFVPKPDLRPKPLLFEEFASWCPRAKFEGDGQRTLIGGRLGTRNVLGMLLRTFGLAEAVSLAHPRAWVSGLAEAERALADDGARKARWWELARRAAAALRARRGVKRVAVIGALTRPEALHFWSELSLVVWDLPGGTFENYELLETLDPERVIDLIDPERATKAEQRLIETAAVEI